MNTHSLLLPGGRIKAASLPVGHLQNSPDQHIQDILAGKNPGVNLGFFPRVGRDLSQARDRQPLRPYISTHQGMPGNFFPFQIGDDNPLDKIYHASDSGFEVAIEPRFSHLVTEEMRARVQDCMNTGDFRGAFELFQSIPQIDNRAESKGRTPFFICRPNSTDVPVQIPSSVLPHIDQKVSELLLRIQGDVSDLYKQENGTEPSSEYKQSFLETLLYFQPDVHIPLSGDPQVESIQMPDVGFFLETFSDQGSLKDIKGINRDLRTQVSQRITECNRSKKIVFLTGKNVIEGKEDILEQREMQVLGEDLKNLGRNVQSKSVEDFEFSPDTMYILLNFSYTPEIQNKLFSLATRYPENFSPNPFLQYVSKKTTGYPSITLNSKDAINRFRGTTFYNEQKGDIGSFQKTLREHFSVLRIDPDVRILQLQKANGEILYVSTDSVYSLRKIKGFLEKEPIVSIVVSPYRHGNMRIYKEGSDLLHAYRFMYAKNNTSK